MKIIILRTYKIMIKSFGNIMFLGLLSTPGQKLRKIMSRSSRVDSDGDFTSKTVTFKQTVLRDPNRIAHVLLLEAAQLLF